ncbi:MAG: hypothetical protein HYX41_02450, partial [Bdellovibrio sp.]|nr:hypothetical protein [Bdellovibrio sp.]
MRFEKALLIFCYLIFSANSSYAAGKKNPTAVPPLKDGKRFVAIEKVPQMRIELPDDTIKDFGEAFQFGLIGRLVNSGKFGAVDARSGVRANALEKPSFSDLQPLWD